VIYKDNPSASLAVEKGDVDWAGLFIPSVWEMWEKKKLPIGTWYNEKPYYLPDGVGFVYLNNTNLGFPILLSEKRSPTQYLTKKCWSRPTSVMVVKRIHLWS